MVTGNAYGKFAALFIGLAACFAGFGGGGARAQAAPDYAALLAAPDRSDADREADSAATRRRFSFSRAIRPGMKVLDMGAGAGYSSEPMARVVSPKAWSTRRTRPISATSRRRRLAARMRRPR